MDCTIRDEYAALESVEQPCSKTRSGEQPSSGNSGYRHVLRLRLNLNLAYRSASLRMLGAACAGTNGRTGRVSGNYVDTGAESPQPVRPRLTRLAGQTSFSGNVLANYLGRGWEALMSVAFVPFYIRYLGPEAYGVIGLVALIQSFMLILDFGMTPALTREAARHSGGEHSAEFFKDLIRSVEWAAGAIGLMMVAIVALGASAIAAYWVQAQSLGSDQISQALTLGGVLIATRFFESIYRGTLQGLERQVLSNAIAAAIASIRGLGALALLGWFDGNLSQFLIWQVVVSLASVLAMRLGVSAALPRTDRAARFSAPALRSISRFAGGMLAISVLALAATQADKLLLSRLLPLREFGFYVFAANLAIILELTVTPLMTAVYPRLVALHGQGDEAALAAYFHRWAMVVAAVTAPVAAWLAFLGPEIVLAWSFDPELALKSGTLLSVIALGTFMHAQCALPYYLQIASGWTALSVWINALALSLVVVALGTMVPRYGAIAGSWTWVAVAALYFFGGLGAMFMRLLRGEGRRFFLRDVGLPAVAAFGVIGSLAAVFDVLAPQAWLMRILLLGIALAAGLLATGLVVRLNRSR
jgi:O-antigen/teichoic acid export membrane protein